MIAFERSENSHKLEHLIHTLRIDLVDFPSDHTIINNNMCSPMRLEQLSPVSPTRSRHNLSTKVARNRSRSKSA